MNVVDNAYPGNKCDLKYVHFDGIFFQMSFTIKDSVDNLSKKKCIIVGCTNTSAQLANFGVE